MLYHILKGFNYRIEITTNGFSANLNIDNLPGRKETLENELDGTISPSKAFETTIQSFLVIVLITFCRRILPRLKSILENQIANEKTRKSGHDTVFFDFFAREKS